MLKHDELRDDVLVCSFYTDDDFYRGHAKRLQVSLEKLGIEIVLREIVKQPGENWAQLCRKKVGFIAEVCAANPNKKVFWIDVDCDLFEIPDYVMNFSADIVGFQRGFSTPMKIGYATRTRFWEPCFWGINTTPQARKMIADAHALEEKSTLTATDDYFFEEAWRANSTNLSFQIIPSSGVIGKGRHSELSRNAFFYFGSSGNVAEFKGKVQQHSGGDYRAPFNPRKIALRYAKKVERRLSNKTSFVLRAFVDGIGITGLLTAKGANEKSPNSEVISGFLRRSLKTDSGLTVKEIEDFKAQTILNPAERSSLRAAETYLAYSSRKSNEEFVLAWWPRPFPGNFGDWLSPYIFSHYTDKKIVFQNPSRRAHKKHIIAIGSIGRFIKKNSVVVGTGISSPENKLQKKAHYISLRGPITAELLVESGGPRVTSFGDPAIVLSRVFPVSRSTTNGRVAFIRHHAHRQLPVNLTENMDEISVLLSHPTEIEEFLRQLNSYDSVVTSAMHVFITCQSYGIPCALIKFEQFKEAVHGTGIKYPDYSLGAGLDEVNPHSVALDFRSIDFAPLTSVQTPSSAKMDEVEKAIRDGLALFDKKKK